MAVSYRVLDDDDTYKTSYGAVLRCNGRADFDTIVENGIILSGLAATLVEKSGATVKLVLVQSVFGWWTAYDVSTERRYMSLPDNNTAAFEAWADRRLARYPGLIPHVQKRAESCLPRHYFNNVHYIALGVQLISANELALHVREVPGTAYDRPAFNDTGAIERFYARPSTRHMGESRAWWGRYVFDRAQKCYRGDGMPHVWPQVEIAKLYKMFEEAWTLFMAPSEVPGTAPAAEAKAVVEAKTAVEAKAVVAASKTQVEPERVAEVAVQAQDAASLPWNTLSAVHTTIFACDKLLDGVMTSAPALLDRSLCARRLAVYFERRAVALRMQVDAMLALEPVSPDTEETP